jgi:hypothetical protein
MRFDAGFFRDLLFSTAFLQPAWITIWVTFVSLRRCHLNQLHMKDRSRRVSLEREEPLHTFIDEARE